MRRSVAEHVEDPRHAAGTLSGAEAVGEGAGPRRLLVRLGVWRSGGRVTRARYRASTCAALIVPVGCFPELYAALAGARIDQVITL